MRVALLVASVLALTSSAHASSSCMSKSEARKHFGTLEPADIKRLRQLEQENGRLKKMVADRDLEIDVLKEITRKKW